MKTLKLIKRCTAVMLFSIIVACGAETVVALVFIPAFAAEWPVQGVEGYSIDLQPDDANKGVPSGVFEGRELNHPTDPNRQDNLLEGSFNGLNIEFTIDRPNGNIQYKGKMTPVSDEDHTIVRIDLNSSEGKLVLSPD
ncbi:hypothetical protein [Algibacter mikhailovii]|uniref:hypothetical protein n=1 Tax=Algibacter mikhailovii TaxID=425498 RepID=UPI0024940CEF|nr:hypothetical protein [Algibacter mikhailovii]